MKVANSSQQRCGKRTMRQRKQFYGYQDMFGVIETQNRLINNKLFPLVQAPEQSKKYIYQSHKVNDMSKWNHITDESKL